MKNNLKITPLKITIISSALIISLYYFVYMIFCLTGFDSPLMCIFALFVIGCVSLPIIFKDKLKVLLKNKYRPLKIIFAALLVIYILSVIFFWCYIGFDSSLTPTAYINKMPDGYTGEDAIVMVFGCHTNGMTPGDNLALRLQAAYTLLYEFPDALCVVSGGQGPNETVPEALSMKAYLVNLGIDGSRIIMESESHSTSENIRFTKSVIEEMGLSDKKIIGVSTAFHLPRIDLMSKRYSIPMELCSAPNVSFPYHYVSMIREYMSYIKMAIFG